MIALVPGSYLYATRIRSARGLLSYLWLEFLPSAALLVAIDCQTAATYVATHWTFLGLYEIGYMWNDRALTRLERPTTVRPVMTLTTSARIAMIGCRVAVFAIAAESLLRLRNGETSATYVGLSIFVVALLFLHTRIGATLKPNDIRRCISFGWLAALKYLPALAAAVDFGQASAAMLLLFVAYGAGRTLEYGLEKNDVAVRRSALDINACWFIAALPVSSALAVHWSFASSAVACLAAIGGHHLAATLARSTTR